MGDRRVVGGAQLFFSRRTGRTASTPTAAMLQTSSETACMLAGAAALTVLAHSYCTAPARHHYAPGPCSALRRRATPRPSTRGGRRGAAGAEAAPAAGAADAADAWDGIDGQFNVSADAKADFDAWSQGATSVAQKRAPKKLAMHAHTTETTHHRRMGTSVPTIGRCVQPEVAAPAVTHPECMLYMPESMADTVLAAQARAQE